MSQNGSELMYVLTAQPEEVAVSGELQIPDLPASPPWHSQTRQWWLLAFPGRRNWPPALPLSMGFYCLETLDPHVSGSLFSLLCQRNGEGDSRAEWAE